MKRSLLHLVFTLCAVGLVYADQTTRSFQQILKQQGFYYGAVTGDKSAEMTAAIRRYQIRNGLKVTGEINEETTRSLNLNPGSVAAVSQRSSKPAASQLGSVPDASSSLSQTPARSFSQPDRSLQTNSSYSTSFYQSAPLRVNRRTIAAAQFQLMRRGYYRGRIDGSYGSRTTFGLRAFQSTGGLAPTGRLDPQTLDALGLSGADLADAAPTATLNEAWMPVRKFKHGKWKVKWKKHDRGAGDEYADEDQ
jgi:peptidoglycan hydrolase-like protein with peptidoglycan-binding domain